jgi:MshEN domain
MGLLGKLFGGGKKKNSGSPRAKRGRAPSIASAPVPNPDDLDLGNDAVAGVPVDEVVLDPGANATAIPVEALPSDVVPVEIQSSGPVVPVEAISSPGAAAPAAPKRVAPPPPKPAVDSSRRSTRTQSRQKAIGELLISAEKISTEQLSRALKTQEQTGGKLLGQILVAMGACDIAAISQALNRQFRISTVEMDRVSISSKVAALVDEASCREHRLIPFEKLGKVLCIAMANCLNRKAINQIEEDTKLKVKPFNCSWIEIRAVIEKVYAEGGLVAEAAVEANAVDAGTTTAAVETIAKEIQAKAGVAASPAAVEPSVDSDQARPFTGPARAVIEGLDDLDNSEAEVVATTERGLASKHLKARQDRREERQKAMGTGKGVVGRVVAHGLDEFDPNEHDVQAVEAVEIDPSEAGELVDVEVVAVHGADADIAATPQAAAVEAAGTVAAELPSVPVIRHEPVIKELLPLKDDVWNQIKEDYEDDPVAIWMNTFAAAVPVARRVTA